MPSDSQPGAPQRRRQVHLSGYDYSQAGAYFVTICTHERRCLFGGITDGEMRLNAVGQDIQRHWLDLPNHHAGVELDEYVVMPNHIHGVIVIGESEGGIIAVRGEGEAGLAPTATQHARRAPGGAGPAPTGDVGSDRRATLATIVGSFKSACTRTVNQRLERAVTLWLRGYYEHVIRGEAALARIREYIAENPAKWALDRDNPANWRR